MVNLVLAEPTSRRDRVVANCVIEVTCGTDSHRSFRWKFMGYHGIEHPGFHTSPSSPICASPSCTNFAILLRYTNSFSPQGLDSSWGGTADDVQNCALLAEHVGARVSTSVCCFCCFCKGCLVRTFCLQITFYVPQYLAAYFSSLVCLCLSHQFIQFGNSNPFQPFPTLSTLSAQVPH